jgi:hypothetical protein
VQDQSVWLLFVIVEEQRPCESQHLTCHRHRRTDETKIVHGTTSVRDQSAWLLFVVVEEQKPGESE